MRLKEVLYEALNQYLVGKTIISPNRLKGRTIENVNSDFGVQGYDTVYYDIEVKCGGEWFTIEDSEEMEIK